MLTSSAPGRIVAGGNLDITVGAGLNDASQILAGGTLTVRGGAIANPDRTAQGSREEHGQLIRATINSHSWDSDERIYNRLQYDVVEPTTVFLTAGKIDGGQSVTTGRSIEALSKGQGGAVGSGQTVAVGGARVNAIVEVPAAPGSGGGAGATGQASGSGALVVRTSAPNGAVPTSSLFGVRSSGSYLVETDPRFANYRNWLSSDYLLNNLGLDPNNTQKRLGDGF